MISVSIIMYVIDIALGFVVVSWCIVTIMEEKKEDEKKKYIWITFYITARYVT